MQVILKNSRKTLELSNAPPRIKQDITSMEIYTLKLRPSTYLRPEHVAEPVVAALDGVHAEQFRFQERVDVVELRQLICHVRKSE
jgi:hypothetical protein